MNLKYWLGHAMIYGGAFAAALGRAVLRADDDNYQRLQTAFPELFERYRELAEKLKQQDDAKP